MNKNITIVNFGFEGYLQVHTTVIHMNNLQLTGTKVKI